MFTLGAGASNVTVANNIFDAVGGNGVSFGANSGYAQVTGNRLATIVGTGIYIGTNAPNVTVVANTLDNIVGRGIDVLGSDARIEGNLINGTQDHGIFIQAPRATVTSNTVRDVGPIAGGRTAILTSSTLGIFSLNHVTDDRASKTTDYGIRETGSADLNLISNNLIRASDVVVSPIVKLGASTIVRNNLGYATEARGTSTQSGTGAQTVFNIAHGLAAAPTGYIVTAGSSTAASAFYVTADATNIVVTFSTAPASGTNNVILLWQAEV